jgi:Leucine-rich repeat (LRR) protein
MIQPLLAPNALFLSYKNIKGVLDLSEYHGFTSLYCHSNKIEEIINFPETLIRLSCSNNKITKLSNLPDSLESIRCDYDMCFDRLPNSLKSLELINVHNGDVYYIKDFDIFKIEYPHRFSEGTDYILK